MAEKESNIKHVTRMVENVAGGVICLGAVLLCTPFGWVGLFILYAMIHGLK